MSPRAPEPRACVATAAVTLLAIAAFCGLVAGVAAAPVATESATLACAGTIPWPHPGELQ